MDIEKEKNQTEHLSKERGEFTLTVNEMGMVCAALDHMISLYTHCQTELENADQYAKTIVGDSYTNRLQLFQGLRENLRKQSYAQWAQVAMKKRRSEDEKTISG